MELHSHEPTVGRLHHEEEAFFVAQPQERGRGSKNAVLVVEVGALAPEAGKQQRGKGW